MDAIVGVCRADLIFACARHGLCCLRVSKYAAGHSMTALLRMPEMKPQVLSPSSRLKSSIAPRPGPEVGAGLHKSASGATNVGSGSAHGKAAAASTAGARSAHTTHANMAEKVGVNFGGMAESALQ